MFWEDTWLGKALSYIFPNLYNIVHKKYATTAEVFSTTPLNVSFRRALIGNKLLEWNNLIATIANVNL
jgi:BarA-like signal transduction histidine kinase